MAGSADVDRELKSLEAELRRLEAEYTMYFSGRLPRPPVETRRRVAGMVRHLDRQRLTNYAERFRFTTLQTRFHKFSDLWDRGMRAREEGRPGPFAGRTSSAPAAPAAAEPAGGESDSGEEEK